MKSSKKILLMMAVVGFAILFAACDAFNQVTEPFTLALPSGQISANGLDIDTKNGSIQVYYWNESFVKVEGEKRVNGLGDLESELEKISINYAFEANQLHIYASFPDDMNKLFKNISYGASLNVFIPKGLENFSDYKMNTSNGAITVNGFDGLFDLRTSNGGINLSNCNGVIKTKTSNASVDLSNIKGQMDVTTSNGQIKFSNCFLTDASHYFNTSNGSIKGNLSLPLSGNVSLITSNGSINLNVPSNTAADFVANTSNGSISIRGLPVIYSSDNKTSKTGKINNGGVRLELKTSNGSINLGE